MVFQEMAYLELFVWKTTLGNFFIKEGREVKSKQE